MSDFIFLFDLDSTITKEEVLPLIASKIGLQKEMHRITELTMQGKMPFKESFLKRVDLLKSISVEDVRSIVCNIALNEHISSFISNHAERCFVVTGNLDVWICDLMKKLGISHHTFCSIASVKRDNINDVIYIADKESIAKQFIKPIVVIGDGDNDAGMACVANIAIGYGGVRNIAPALKKVVDYSFYDDYQCVDFLNSLL